VINNKRGVLTSPGYPESYGDELYCEYTITAPNEYLEADFQEFRLEKGKFKTH
jgi:hypothetical protein